MSDFHQHRRKIVYNYFHLKTCTKFFHSVCSLKNFVVFCVFHLKNFFFIYSFFYLFTYFSFLNLNFSFLLRLYFFFFIKAFIFNKILPQKHISRFRNSMNRNDEKHISCLLIQRLNMSWTFFFVFRFDVWAYTIFPIFQFFLLSSFFYTRAMKMLNI